MVTLKGIQETHPRMSHHGVHQLVNSRNKEGVFWADFVQVSEIHAHLPFPVFVFNHYYVSQPLEAENLLNGSSLLQLIHLCPDCLDVIFR